MKRLIRDKGSLTLETAIVLPIFFFMFLFVFCFFGLVSARNQIHHALLQSAKSLSMDSMLNESVESAAEKETKFWGNFADMIYDLVRLGNDPYFSSSTDWYKNTSSNYVIQRRFIGYLAGSDDDAIDEASEKLRRLGVADGIDGIEFEYSVSDGDLEITATYEWQAWFNFFGVGSFPMEDKVTVRMWGFDDSASTEA